VSLTVRPCRLEECARILEIWRQAEAIPRPTDTLPEVQRIVREHPGTLLVGEENGRLVGSVIAGWDGWRGGRAAARRARRAPALGDGGARRAAGGRLLERGTRLGARSALAPLRERLVA
jgi:hypothetical protein